VRVAWTGANGPVRFVVLDARGRRVAGGDGGGVREGEWTWNGRGMNGSPLPAGVYFVSARDATGHSASERVVLVQ
jgi:hypothetical protein